MGSKYSPNKRRNRQGPEPSHRGQQLFECTLGISSERAAHGRLPGRRAAHLRGSRLLGGSFDRVDDLAIRGVAGFGPEEVDVI